MRISFKLLGISEAVLIVAIIALLFPMHKEMHRQAVDRIQGELRSMAINAAPLIVGDLPLETGDRIFLASDGLPEAMNAHGTHFGVARMEEVVAGAPDCNAVVAQLRRELIAHCNGPSQTDDVTILCVDRL